MKRFLTILAVAGIGLSACHKDDVDPVSTPGSSTTTPKTTASVGTGTNNISTVATDTTKGYLRVQIAMNATATDDILIEFNPAASASYSGSEDARTFQGMGAVSLSSMSSDGVPLAINALPLVSSGTSIPLAVGAGATGVYKLNLTTISSIPSGYNIWLKDKYNKDSMDFRKYPSYAFNINKADSATFGSDRFSLVLRAQK